MLTDFNTHTYFNDKELYNKFKPLKKISLQKWSYKPSIKRIVKRETSATGRVSYCVQFLNNETISVCMKKVYFFFKKKNNNLKIPANKLRKTYYQLIEDFELDLFKFSELENNTQRRSKRLDQRPKEILSCETDNLAQENLRKSVQQSKEATSSKDKNSIKQLSVSTRSGRIQVIPTSFQEEFYAIKNVKKKSNEKSYNVSFYSDEFIKQHTKYCFRCHQTGFPNGRNNDAEAVSCGPECARIRLLLCQTCTLSCHNNCLSATSDIYFDANTYTCVKCKNKKMNCIACHQSLNIANDFIFRCKICFRTYHPQCIDLDDYQEGDCLDCITYQNRQPQSILAQRTNEKDQKELLIRWKDVSFRHANWVSSSWLQATSTVLFTKYKSKYGTEDTQPKNGRYFPIEWITIERILDVIWEENNKQKAKCILAVFKDTEYGDGKEYEKKVPCYLKNK